VVDDRVELEFLLDAALTLQMMVRENVKDLHKLLEENKRLRGELRAVIRAGPADLDRDVAEYGSIERKI
jgi:hypothetical protein